ncbi:hypothetical protein CAK95_04930 [Pseudorhodoplanes sinuspersici]|uniref:Uncharacterized protein n=2 Tax=Pseudorhodoplanes sinuspersici TaxID=1235591 RepID=A0A1W6ZM55_9HYPH|nr:hypothetical protein CAK95_04930 [Pseudorhodoplanes sinuspersici]
MAAAEKASSYFVVLPTERRPMIEIMRRVGGKVISSYLDSGAGDVLSEAGPLLMANLSLRSVDAAGGVPLGRKLR